MNVIFFFSSADFRKSMINSPLHLFSNSFGACTKILCATDGNRQIEQNISNNKLKLSSIDPENNLKS